MGFKSTANKSLGLLSNLALFAAPFVTGDPLTAFGSLLSLLRRFLNNRQSLERVLLQPVEQLLKENEIPRNWRPVIEKIFEDRTGLLILFVLLIQYLIDSKSPDLQPLTKWLLEKNEDAAGNIAKKIGDCPIIKRFVKRLSNNDKNKKDEEAKNIAEKIANCIQAQSDTPHFNALRGLLREFSKSAIQDDINRFNKEIIERFDAINRALNSINERLSSIERAIFLDLDNYKAHIQDFYKDYKYPLFVGRKEVIDKLNDWLDDPAAPPYLLLVAPAGRGKSALLARWQEKLQNREDVYLIFVPISIRYVNSETEVFKILVAHMADLFNEKVPRNYSLQEYVNEFRRYLSKLNTSYFGERSILIILEGLDEADSYKLFKNLFPRGEQVPAKLRVVVSARSLAGDRDASGWCERLGWPPDEVRFLELGLLDREAMLEAVDCILPNYAQRNKLAGTLYELSDKGDPLLVKLYVDIIKNYKHAEKVLEVSSGIKPGLEGYFENWWRELEQQQDWKDEVPETVLEVTNLLSAALAPLLREELLALGKMHPVNLDKALSKLGRLISGDGKQRGYVFSHPRLAQYFWEDKLTEAQRGELDQKFLRWGWEVVGKLSNKQLSPGQVPPYLVRAFGKHLARVGAEPADWLRLVHPRWAEASEVVGGSLDFFLEDLERAWRACIVANEQAIKRGELAPYLGGEVRCALLKARLHTKADLPAGLLVRLVEAGVWRWEYGLSYAYQIPRPEERAEALTKLATLLPEDRPAEQKSQLLDEALAAAREIDDSDARAKALAALAPHMSHEQLGQALAAAYEIGWSPACAEAFAALDPHLSDAQRAGILNHAQQSGSELDRAVVLAAFAKHLSPEQRDEVLNDAQQINYPQIRAKVLSELAKWLPDDKVKSVLDKFLDSVQQIQNSAVLAEVFVELAPCLSGVQLNKALNIAQQFKTQNELIHATIMAALVPYLQDPQQLNAVWNEVQQFKNEFARAELLAALAPRLSPEQLNEALKAAQAIDWPFARAEVLAALASRLSPEQLSDVLDTIRDVDLSPACAEVIEVIAPYLLSEQLVDKALKIALQIDELFYRRQALAALAPRLPPEHLRAALHAAWQADTFAYAKTLAALIPHLPAKQRLSVLERAFDAALKVEDEFARAEALAVLAPHLSNKQQLSEALNAAQQMSSLSARAEVLAALVPHLPENEKSSVLADVLNAAKQMVLYDQVLVLAALTPHLSSTQRGNVLNLARQIENPQILAEVLTSLAPHLSPQQLRSAFSLAQSIGNPDFRDQALAALIPLLPNTQIPVVLNQIQRLQRPASRSKLLAALAPHLSGQQKQKALDEALAAAREIDWLPYRARALAALAPHAQHLSMADLYSFWCDTLRALAAHTLPELLSDLQTLVPAIVALGGQRAAEDIARALLDFVETSN